MGTITVNIPDGMEDEMDKYIEETGLFMNRSELVRDAVRRRIEDDAPISAETLERIEQSKKDMREESTYSVDELRTHLGLDADTE